jgi:hypothetical protein
VTTPRDPADVGRIETVDGVDCARGTMWPVDAAFAHHYDTTEILGLYPFLDRVDVLVAIGWCKGREAEIIRQTRNRLRRKRDKLRRLKSALAELDGDA